MPNDQYVNEASTSRCKKQLVWASTPNHTLAEKPSHLYHWRREAEIKVVEGRLRVLEEEAEMLKAAVEESRKIMSEIHLHFNTIQNCMLNRGESYSHGMQIVSHHKDRTAGLLQILCQESNPSIVNKPKHYKMIVSSIGASLGLGFCLSGFTGVT